MAGGGDVHAIVGLAAFADFWPVPAWRVRATAVAADQPTLAADAARVVDKLVTEPVLRALMGELDRLATEIAQALVTRLEVILPLDSPDRPVLLAMITRDLVWHWLRPHWRAQLSYRQLCQSRLWTRRLTEAPSAPFALRVCVVEEAIAGAADPLIRKSLDPNLRQLRDLVGQQLPTTGTSKADVDAVALAVSVEKFEETLESRVERAYGARL